MGADYSSISLIGLKVDPDKLYTTKIEKAFHHNHPETMKFDPETGKALWKEVAVPIPDFEDEKTIMGYPVVWGTDNGEVFIAIAVASGTDSNGGRDSSRTDISNIKVDDAIVRMKFDLNPLGLWDEKEFGLWTVLYCSY